MKYTTFFDEIVKFFNRSSQEDYEVNTKMTTAVELWKAIYANKAPWLDKTVKSMNIAKSISAEFARLVTMESDFSVSGSQTAKIIDDELTAHIKPKIRRFLEYGLALGSFVLKPLVNDGKLMTQIIQAGNFFPLAFDTSGKISECAFSSQIKKGNQIFSLIERHTLKGNKYIVENYAFRSSHDESLGVQIPITDVERWAKLPERTEISDVNELPFGLFCVPLANQIDSTSPLGVSVFSGAVDLIREADKRYSALCWEYESKESAVYISEAAFQLDKSTGKAKIPQGKERLYVPLELDMGVTESKYIDVYSPDIRSAAIIEGISHQQRLIEFACSLAYGSLSDPNTVEKTAEEIRSSKQRSYAFVRDVQNALESALTDYINACAFWLSIYSISPATSKLDISFTWGDSILNDPDSERQNDRDDLANGTLRPEEYRAKYRNESIEEAAKNLPSQADVII